MTTFFTADTHFGHTNIIKLCNRPFSSVLEMNEAIVQKWNEVVRPSDTVYHLGDFAFRQEKPRDTEEIFSRLNGLKILIRGNHDPHHTVTELGWDTVHDSLELNLSGTRLFLSHYPHMEWPGFYRGVYHLFGHVHGRFKAPWGRCMDVGVDAEGYSPIPLEKIVERLCDLDNDETRTTVLGV